MKVHKVTSTSYWPQTQGLVERFNKTVVSSIKRLASPVQEKWHESLPLATHAYNTTVQKTNGCSPYEAMFGVTPASTFDKLVEREQTVEGVVNVTELQQNLDSTHTAIRAAQENERKRMKSRYDAKARPKQKTRTNTTDLIALVKNKV